ncbi:CAP-Gly domain-containing linker protein 1-like isoform X2 [Paramacrobiotus metropolitanus]|uniref:CAP-Gly domain-containing linker protein 1-like isoform X2 n=1 Tax=Paramacrobiotus metropolitanus TaxID=2943436 RepID=UPI002445FBE3|nr:CAP-Gly domain-containing linker protein 1-like isoform X2 [Paramacrobiotus metropolitanus]
MDSKLPNSGSQSGLRPAGLPSAAQQRAPPVIAPASPRPVPTGSIPAPGQLKKAGSVHFTVDTEGFIVGDRVWVHGTKAGKIQFIGETKFAPGEWAGIVLDEPTGKNDGSVNGVRYFQCEANRGVFVRLHKLSRVPLSPEEIETLKMQKLSAATSVASIISAVDAEFKSPDSSLTGVNKSTEPGSSVAGGDVTNAADMKVGDRVWLSGDRAGIVRFVGKPHFQDGIWVGVELDEAKGKNDGSVEGKRYFTCPANHGVMAPIAKVSKGSSGAALPPFTPGKLKRSPSQESLHSNFSIQSTASRRSSAMRMGTSALSPSTIAVGRTGTGTAADIIKAHQEKDALIVAMTKERDLAKKELAAKLGNEMQMHTEIQKLQEQYMGALSNQDARIADMSENIKKLNAEKDQLREQLDDEKKKVEDLQFRLEEELMAKDSEAELETKKLIDRKSSEIDSLKGDISRLNQEMETLRQVIQDKDLEVDRWRTAVDASKLEAADMVDERDRTSFEVADLRRQLRDVSEKYRQENETFQQSMRSKDALEQELNLQLECARAELEDYRRRQSAVSSSKLEENSNLQVIIDDLKRDNTSQQVHIQELTNDLHGLREERNLLKNTCDTLERNAQSRRSALTTVFRDVGHCAPEKEDEEIPALLALLSDVRSKAAATSDNLKTQLAEAERALSELRLGNAQLDSERGALQKRLAEATDSLASTEKMLLGANKEKEDLLRSIKNSETKNEEVLLESEKILKDHVHEAKRLLEDKSREVESLAYQLSELSVELGSLKSAHQELVQRSQSDLSHVNSDRQEEVERLMQKHAFEIGVLKRDFEQQNSALRERLTTVESELQTALTEKFIGVLNEKDAELKEAREQIERTIAETLAQHHEEKNRIYGELVQEKEKFAILEEQLAAVTLLEKEKNASLEATAANLEVKERDFAILRQTADELAQRCTKLEQDSEQAQSAYAEQMMRAEVRREEDIRVLTTEKNSMVDKISNLEEQIQLLSSTSLTETETMRTEFLDKINLLQSVVVEKNALLESTSQELGASKSTVVSMNEEISRLKKMMEACDVEYNAAKGELDSLTKQCQANEEIISAINADKASLVVVLEQKDKELQDLAGDLAKAKDINSLLKNDLDLAGASFEKQLAVAQERAGELQTSVDTERNSLMDRIKTLENQLSDTVTENTAKLEAEHSDFRHKLNTLETELAAKTSALLASGNDILFLKAEIQKSQHEVARLSTLLQESEQNLTVKLENIKQLDRDRTDSENKLTNLEKTLQLLENNLKQHNVGLEQANQTIVELESDKVSLSDVILSLKSDLVSASDLGKLLSEARDELAIVQQAKSAAEARIQELEAIAGKVGSLETTVHDQSVKLTSSDLRLSSMESEIFQSQSAVTEITTALSVAKEAIVRTEAEREKLQNDNVKLTERLNDAEQALKEMDALKEAVATVSVVRDQVEKISQEKVTLETQVWEINQRAAEQKNVIQNLESELLNVRKNAEQEIAEMKERDLRQQKLVEELENELVEMRKNAAGVIGGEVESAQDVHLASQRSIDELLSAELERVQSEVEFHRRLIEQRDGEISRMKLHQRDIVDQKNSEIAQIEKKVFDAESALRKEKLQKLALSTSSSSAVSAGDNNEFQVQLLNSIIAEQQTKLMDMEKKLKALTPKPSASGLADVPPAEPAVAPKRRPIRLYCAQCEQFDEHDTAECPKRHTSPERKPKPKVARPVRKYCEECEKFDLHETTDCPAWIKKHPPRVPLKPTGLVPL